MARSLACSRSCKEARVAGGERAKKKASGKWDPDKQREPVSGVPETTLSFTDSVGEPTGLCI